MKTEKKDLPNLLKDLEEKVEELINKIPYQLPKNIKKLIVDYGPYLLIISLVFGFLSVLNLGFLNQFSYLIGFRGGLVYRLEQLFILLILIIEAVAVPGLFQKKLSSWRLLFYSSLVYLVRCVVVFDFVSLVVGIGLSWYILFQIKEMYK